MDARGIGELRRRIEQAFPLPTGLPPMSLRGGNAVDDYELPPPFDPALDLPNSAYVESYHFGIHHLDPNSWLYYLPILLMHSLAGMETGTSSAIDTILFSLRPPDRDPPRFAVLSPEQREVVVAVLEELGFNPASKYQDEALEALQEYWYSDGAS